MGFMLTECALGWFDLALLHLVAHSLYKAYAFLSSGEAVQAARLRSLASSALSLPPIALWARAVLAPVAAGLVLWACDRLWQRAVPGVDLPLTALLIAALGLSPLLWKGWLEGLLRVGLLCQLYLLGHVGAAVVTAGTPSVVSVASVPTDAVMALWVGSGFLLLYGLQTVLVAHPQGTWSQRLYPLAYAGFYLDEWFTRLTFRLWPARMPRRPAVGVAGGGPTIQASAAPAARAAARGGSL
jgi:NAD(P)H-quinone oxidoreductase subunit 5